ncbi:methyl-accepting chemotaxis protein [Allorhizobium undicola]|uniref:methyl-accepting chemotaxis protein n=1 Tax=Allorhizobium undicola TaxID=78527 RepID=UPI003D346EE6
MFVDRLLARFRIQTKVLVFIFPFILSISAVGLTGLYASSLLQARMDMSSSVLQALSGFKNVYAGMTLFLQQTSAETKQALDARVSEQMDVLTKLGGALQGAEGRAEVEAAISGTNAMSAQVGRLWTLYQAELSERHGMEAALEELARNQADLTAEANGVRDRIANDEARAKAMLREAEKLTRGATVLAKTMTDYNALQEPQQRFALLKEHLAELKDVSAAVLSALPADQRVVGQGIADSVQVIGDQVDIGVVNDATIGTLDRAINVMRPSTIRLQGAASLKARDATQVFGTLDKPMAEAALLVDATRQMTDAMDRAQLGGSRFLTTASAQAGKTFDSLLSGMKERAAALAANPALPDGAKARFAAMGPLAEQLSAKARKLTALAADRDSSFRQAAQEIDQLWSRLTSFAAVQQEAADSERSQANRISVGAMSLGVLIAVFAGIGLVVTFKGPIGQITAAMRRLASGDLQTDIAGDARADEIGDMARALGVFKENAEAKLRIEAESERERAAAEAERQRNDAEKQEADRQIQFAVAALAEGLERLADGDVSRTIDTPFTGRLEQLRLDFNRSLNRLQGTLMQIKGNVQSIQGNVQQMAQAADDLSRRTETQAASLEETAAAVNEVTSNVRSAADQARQANMQVGETRRHAEGSVVVVGNAIAAMGRIEEASTKIEQIIDVIEDIAFQTNLLALNAGVEAARAGEAGKGFAVVAQEVRELAQRSGRAANEIKALIHTSTTEVNAGAKLVQETGAALTAIGQQISAISETVERIAATSRDQSAALGEVNGAVTQMDQLTQQNAAMVEETSAASRQLAEEADQLASLLQQFRTEQGAGRGARYAA